MPAVYAHFRFGRDVLTLLPPERRQRILPYLDLFDIGLHGPDIFFFHQPYHQNAVSAVGHALHRQSGGQALHRLLLLKDRLDTPQAEAYVDGFLCHFVLDTVCHPYVCHIAGSTPISHTCLETELDRVLLLQDGLEPLSQPLADHIRPSAGAAAVVASLIPDVTAHQVDRALRQMLRYDRLLLAPHAPKRTALHGLFRMIGKEEAFGSRVMAVQPRAACVPMAARLLQHYEQAVPLAADLLQALPELSHPCYTRNFLGESTEAV